MREETKRKLQQISEKYTGYISTKELLREGVTNRQILAFTQEGMLERVSCGHYWLSCGLRKKPEEYKALEVSLADPEAIICADSAFFYWGLTDREPERLSVMTRRGDRRKLKMNFPVNRHYCPEELFLDGVVQMTTEYGTYRLYSKERSFCDCIRFRDSLKKEDFDVIVENYSEQRDRQIERIMEYAKKMRISKRIKEYL